MEPACDHVTPNQEMIDLFDSWDTTKTKSKLKSFNRAKSWLCRLQKCPFPGLPKGHHLRREDTDNAFQLVLEAYSSGILFEDYIKSNLLGTIIVQSENDTNVANVTVAELATITNGDNEDNESNEDSFSDAPETITNVTQVVVAIKHCEPDCSQCREAAATGEDVVTAVTETITEETGVASATSEATVSGETTAAEVPKRPPVCHFSWLAEVCTVVGCQKSHPPLCENPRCLELDQDLPRWKSTGCKKWHGRTKSLSPKPRTAKKPKVSSQKSRMFHGSRPQTMGPVGLPAPWSHAWEQPIWNQMHQMGNGQAAQTPLSRGGNNQWGNGMMPYNVAVKGPNTVIPSQFELDFMALVLNRVLNRALA